MPHLSLIHIYICSHEDLVASANNVVYALIALDEAGISNVVLRASGSSWTRAQLVLSLIHICAWWPAPLMPLL